MSPYEITVPGGAVEYFNEEAGAIWMQRLTQIYERAVWLNPTEKQSWDYISSTQMLRELMGERMYPLTLGGIDEAMSELKR